MLGARSQWKTSACSPSSLNGVTLLRSCVEVGLLDLDERATDVARLAEVALRAGELESDDGRAVDLLPVPSASFQPGRRSRR